MPHPADRRAAERRLFRAGPSGPLSICLVYPNTYAVGMANLGFQAVLRILAEDPRVTADRAFLPDGPRAEWPRTLRSLEQDRPLGDFDVVAFSLSFEADYVHVLDCLALAGIPLWRRRPGHLSQPRADRRVRRPLPDRRGGGDAGRVPRPRDDGAPRPRRHPGAQRGGARRLPARPLHARVRRRA